MVPQRDGGAYDVVRPERVLFRRLGAFAAGSGATPDAFEAVCAEQAQWLGLLEAERDDLRQALGVPEAHLEPMRAGAGEAQR